MKLSSIAVSGVKWISASQFGRQLLQIITTIILAKLLLPDDFGLLYMAFPVIEFIRMLRDLGTSSAIIQREEVSDRLLSSIFWLNLGFGFFSTALILALAPAIASLYGEPRLTEVLMVISVSFFLSGAGMVHQALLEKKFEFNKVAMVEVGATLLSSVAGIGMALAGMGVWALVGQNITLVFFTAILFWFKNPWRPMLVFDLSEIKSVFSYSANLIGFSLFNYLTKNADTFIIGKFLGSEALGFYKTAYRLILYSAQGISDVVSRVMFPLYSKIQNDHERFGSIYVKVTGVVALITFPMMAGLVGVSESFVFTFFKPEWEPMITAMLYLAPAGALLSVMVTTGLIYRTKARTNTMFVWGIITAVVSVASFIIGLRWGMKGVAAGFLATNTLLLIPGFALAFRYIGLPVAAMMKRLVSPVAVSAVILAVTFGVRALLPEGVTWPVVFCVQFAFGAAAGAGALWLFSKGDIKELVSMMRARIQE